jgi:hypothetical protein
MMPPPLMVWPPPLIVKPTAPFMTTPVFADPMFVNVVNVISFAMFIDIPDAVFAVATAAISSACVETVIGVDCSAH